MALKRSIRSDRAPKPIGPYSQAILAGKLVWASGQVALDPATGELVAGGVAEQTRQALKNLAAVMAGAGTSLEHALKATVYLADMKGYDEMNAAWDTWVDKANTPGRATVEARLASTKYLVEIAVIAAV